MQSAWATRMFSSVRVTCLVVAVVVLSGSPLRADFLQIPQPTSAYVNGTTLLDFTDPDTTLIGALSGGGETLVYNNDLEEFSVPSAWGVWGNPPAVETSTPRVGYTGQFTSLTISLLAPAFTFGFELEPDNYAREKTTAAFYSGTNLVGTLTLYPSGDAGALLFAASTTTDPFTGVVITNLANDEFAIARQRFALTPAPEPATLPLAAFALLTALAIRGYSALRYR